MLAKLYYVHDPMCSWCWGFQPQWLKLKGFLTEHFSESIQIENLVGGLAKDTDEPMPVDMQQAIQGYWRDIHNQLGTEFNFDFWTSNTPRRSTFNACRATLAITYQHDSEPAKADAQDRMIDAVQRAYYLDAKNPSDLTVLASVAEALGADRARFEMDMKSEALEQEFEQQLQLARSLPIDGFPSLVLEYDHKLYKIPRNYHDYLPMLETIRSIIER